MSKTIAWLSTPMDGTNEYLCWQGARNFASKHGINIIALLGNRINPQNASEDHANIIYKLVDKTKIDGVIIWASQIGTYVTQNEILPFCKSFEPLPIVTLNLSLPGIPCVASDDYNGMKEIVNHFIKVHNFDKIAFARGPLNKEVAEKRYNGYLDALKENNIPIDQKLITDPGGIMNRGKIIINDFFETKHLKPKTDIQVITCYNITLATECTDALRARGIDIPREITLSGFDYTNESVGNIPQLTTQKVKFNEIGEKAVSTIIDIFEGKKVADKILVPPQLIIKQSCGCQSAIVSHAKAFFDKQMKESKPLTKAEIINSLKMSESLKSLELSDIEKLIDAFNKEQDSNIPNEFMLMFEMILLNFILKNRNIEIWHDFVSEFRRIIMPAIQCENKDAVEDIFQQARAIISDLGQNAVMKQQIDSDKKNSNILTINNLLLTSFKLDNILKVLSENLPKLDVTFAYLSVYENPQKPLEYSKLIMAYENNNIVKINPADRRFPTTNLLPDSILKNKNAAKMIAQPIYFEDLQIGVLIIETDNLEGKYFLTLSKQISSALKGSILLEEIENTRNELLKKSNEVKSLITPMIETMVYITELSNDKIQKTKSIEETISEGSKKMNDAKIGIEMVNESINKMLNIVNIIDDIAVNVKVLAINASITSAHAGDYGKAFAVIALEVRKLSDSTKKNAQEISKVLTKIVNDIKGSAKSTQETAVIFTSVKDETHNLLESLNDISSKMIELNSKSKEILNLINIS